MFVMFVMLVRFVVFVMLGVFVLFVSLVMFVKVKIPPDLRLSGLRPRAPKSQI